MTQFQRLVLRALKILIRNSYQCEMPVRDLINWENEAKAALAEPEELRK